MLAAGCAWAQSANVLRGETAKRCVVGRVVVQECVEELRGLADYTDEFMKRAAMARAQQAVDEERDRQETAKCAARGRLPGRVSIGMSAKDARYCGWGTPADVGRVTSRAGITERWEYPNGRALILLDGKVELIQE